MIDQIPANLFTMFIHRALVIDDFSDPLYFTLDPTGKMVVSLDFIVQE